MSARSDSGPTSTDGRTTVQRKSDIPNSRLVWTNEEAEDGGSVTTVTFEDQRGTTLLVLHELYPSKESLEAALASGEKDGMGETFDQLDQLLAARAA